MTTIFEQLALGIPRGQLPIRSEGPLREVWGPKGLIPADFDAARKLVGATRLDNGATTMPLPSVMRAVTDFFARYGNPHAGHLNAEASGAAIDEALDLALAYAGVSKDQYEAFFAGHGATGGINWLAWSLRHNPDPEGRTKVIVSGRGHHATLNMRGVLGSDNVVFVPFTDVEQGRAPTAALLEAIERHRHEARAVITTPTDNLMGIFEDSAAISEAAHRAGMLHVGDGAHDWGHRMGMTIPPFGVHTLATAGFDVYVTSPHKWYAALADGLVLARRDLLASWDPIYYGGGHVKTVSLRNFSLSDDPRTKHSPGTPNVFGAVAMRAALRQMRVIGPEATRDHEVAMNDLMMGGLRVMDGVQLAGDADPKRTPRAMVWSFIIEGLHHAIGEAALQDHFGLEFRAGCHCAQPAAAALLMSMLGLDHSQIEMYRAQVQSQDKSQVPGLLRPAGALYTTVVDIDRFLTALKWVVAHRDDLQRQYRVLPSGHAVAADDDAWLRRREAYIRAANRDPFDLD